MRKVKICIVMALFCLISTDCLAFKFKPYAGLGFDMRISHSVHRVSNIPLSIRDVSIHPNGLIEKDTVKIPAEIDWLSGIAGIETGWSRFDIRIGAKSRFVMGNHIGREDSHSDQMAKKRYRTEVESSSHCDSCGNTSYSQEETKYYTYYGVEMKEWFTLEPYAELRFIMRNKSFIFAGASFRQFHLRSESGWFKSGDSIEFSLHSKQHDTLAKFEETNFFLGIGGTDYRFYIGMVLLDEPEMFSRAEDTRIAYDRKSFFVGVSSLGDFF